MASFVATPERDWSKLIFLSNPFQSRCWGDSCVVYDPASGATHGIRRNDLLVLQALQVAPKSFVELNCLLDISPEQERSQYLCQLLEAFEGLGLIVVDAMPDVI